MATAKRNELQTKVEALLSDLGEQGINGLLEHADLVKTLQEAQKMHETQQLAAALDGLSDAAEDVIATEEADFTMLVVLAQLIKDIEGPAAPPADSSDYAPFKDLATKLRLALLSGLSGYAQPGTPEAKDLRSSAGALVLVLDKVAGEALLTLAVEKALLRLLGRQKRVVFFLRDRTEAFGLKALREAVAELAALQPEEADVAAADGDEEEDGGEQDDDEEEELEDDGEDDEEDDD